MEQLITAAEAAKLLRISLRTMRALISSRALTVVRIGRRTLISPSALKHLVRASEDPAS